MENSIYLYKLRAKRRAICRQTLGNQCANCGARENLQFDHIDYSNKKFNISIFLAGNWDKLLTELKQCQLLCVDCHKTKTKKEAFDRQFGAGKHGTMWMYWKHKCRCSICREYKKQHSERYKKAVGAGMVIASV